jgi:hypothetical protein
VLIYAEQTNLPYIVNTENVPERLKYKSRSTSIVGSKGAQLYSFQTRFARDAEDECAIVFIDNFFVASISS